MELGNIDFINADDEVGFVPNDIKFQDTVFSLAFHPGASFLAIGLVNGFVEVSFLKGARCEHINSHQLHSEGVRAMEFSEDGRLLATASSDRSVNILDCTTEKSVSRIGAGKENPHKFGISSLNICSETLVATGDDDGMICIWDTRTKKPTHTYYEHGDYISQMLYFSDVYQLVSSSGDTCLGVYDVRRGRIVDYSEKRKDPLTCMAFIPENNTLIAGTAEGKLPMWKYNSWARPYDIFENHPADCDVILTYNDNIVLTGAFDGLVRVLQVCPFRRNLCQVGGNNRHQPVSKMTISHDRKLLACAGNDNIVSFVDITFMEDDAELDRLRSKAEQRHLAVLREATEEMENEKLMEEEEEDSEDDQNDKKEVVKDKVNEAKNVKKIKQEITKRERIQSDSSEDSSDVSDSDDSSEDEEESVADIRQKQRDRVAAAKWLKTEKKKKVNFKFEKKRRRVGGFWGDLN